MRSATSTNSNTDYGNILNKKNANNYDSDFMSYKEPIKQTNKPKSRNNSSDSDSTYKRTKKTANSSSNTKNRKDASESDNSRSPSVGKFSILI